MQQQNISVTKISLSATALMLAVFFGSTNSAKASTTTTEQVVVAPVCELSAALDNLLAVKDSSLTGIARDKAEFDARKAVVTQTIICANIEISDTKSNLSGLMLTDQLDKDLRAQFLVSLQSSEDQYATYSDAVTISTGLFDIKSLAEDILDWRKSEYIPLLDKINDFILVINNEQSTKVARARFEKISTTLSILQLSNVASIKKLLDDSALLTAKADKLNADAHAVVRTYLAPVNSTSTDSNNAMLTASGTPAITDAGADNTTIASPTPIPTPTPAPSVVSLVKLSIGSLKGAYADFLKISVLVRNILGL